MIDTLIGFAIIALAIYIIKSMAPVYYFINNRLSVRKERKQIKDQSNLAKERMDILLENGWERGVACFFKLGKGHVSDDQIKGWSNNKFNDYLENKQ